MSMQNWEDILKQKEAIIKGECFVDMWSIDDIKDIAIDYYGLDLSPTGEEYQLSTQLAVQVLARIKDNYDPNYGINNDYILEDIDYVTEKYEANL